MMRVRNFLMAGALLCGVVMIDGSTVQADGPRVFRYPKVYGATGRPYGPTQAHYQYQKQYGRPWHGYGGLTATYGSARGSFGQRHFGGGLLGGGFPVGGFYQSPFGTNVSVLGGGFGVNFGYQPTLIAPACGFGVINPQPLGFYNGNSVIGNSYGGYGITGFAPVYNTVPVTPHVVGPNPFNNSVLGNSLQENDARWNGPLNLNTADSARPIVMKASPEARLRGLRAQVQGDKWFRDQEFHKAYERYKTAVREAKDQGSAHLRLAVVLAVLNRHDRAAEHLRLGLLADPTLASAPESLEDLFGETNKIAKQSLILNVTAWAKEDIRDPNRLFLLGALLHFDGKSGYANELLTAGYRLAGGGDHFVRLLAAAVPTPAATAGQNANPGQVAQPTPGAGPELPPLDDGRETTVEPLQPEPAPPARPMLPALPPL